MKLTADYLLDWIKHYSDANIGIAVESGDTSLSELGIDSVAAVELVAALEKDIQLDIDHALLWRTNTISQFIQAVINDGATQSEIKHPENIHDFGKYVNPYLGDKLEKLRLDKAFVKGLGSKLFDSDGIEYLDLTAQFGALPFGYNPENIWKELLKVHENAEPSFAQPSLIPIASQLAKELIACAPGNMQFVTFTNSGAESVEAALKQARSFTGRKSVLSTHKAFHGKTMGALSASGSDHYQTPFSLPQPEFSRIPFGCIESLETAFRRNPESYAAFIVEPIQGEAGVNAPDNNYLKACSDLCKQYGVIFIVDEVQTGLGRTGSLFACNDDVDPDIITLAKALGGGLVPSGAVLFNARCYSEKFGMKHSSTFAGNALSARAGLATLHALQENNGELLQEVKQKGEYLKSRLNAIKDTFPSLISEIRGEGLMLGIKIAVNSALWSENFLGLAGDTSDIAQLIACYLLNVEHVRVAPTLNDENVIRIQPAYTITYEEIDHAIASVTRTFKALASGHSGYFFKAIIDGKPQPLEEAVKVQKANLEDRSVDNRFAFLMHPLNANSYADFDGSLNALDQQEIEDFAGSIDGLIDPVITSTSIIESPNGEKVLGDFIMLCRTAESMKESDQNLVQEDLSKAITLAQKRGASIVGLGAYTSVVTQGGLDLVGNGHAITTGNSFTTYSGYKAIELALQRSSREFSDQVAAVIGAAGAIGSASAILLAPNVKQLILIGNPKHDQTLTRKKLMKVAISACREIYQSSLDGQSFTPGSIGDSVASLTKHLESVPTDEQLSEIITELELESGKFIFSNNPTLVKLSNIVISATSMPTAFLNLKDLNKGAIFCDLSRPRTIENEPTEEQTHKDKLIIDGGIVTLPGNPYIGPYGIDEGKAYACMAETILLALEKTQRDVSVGASLPIHEIKRQGQLAEKHGFVVSNLQSFGKQISDERWQEYLEACS